VDDGANTAKGNDRDAATNPLQCQGAV